MKRIQSWVLILFPVFVLALYGSDVRDPTVAGQFYPSDPAKLKLAIEQFIRNAPASSVEEPTAIMVPHAGYVYSGQIMADGYRQVMKNHYDTVVILGVNHTTPGFRGISLGDYSAFRSPLGSVPVDEEISAALMSQNKDCVRSHEVHQSEHSIEVQVPFIQVLFPNAKIVPVVIHPPDYNMCVRFGKTLAAILKNRHALIVMSSDLSHYPSSEIAARTDRQTLETIAGLDTAHIAGLMKDLKAPDLGTRACGEAAILAGITAAKELGAKSAVVAGYTNSGEIPGGDKSRAVGYGAIVIARRATPGSADDLNSPAKPPGVTPLQNSDKKALLSLARETILQRLTKTVPQARNFSSRARVPQGAFVTLRKTGELRGCIGRMSPDLELAQAVAVMALESAFNDPRFPPVQISELKNLEIEISALTPMKPISGPEEIVPGRDGVLLLKDGRSAVFLPQVAVENKWNRGEMLDQLCVKAGLSPGCWKKDARFQVFQADVFSDSQFK